MSFTTTELILLILIVSIILIIFVILTISEIKDYLRTKNRLMLTEEDEDVVVNKTVVRKEPIVLDKKEEKVKENVIFAEEEVVLPKPKKSAIIIEEEEEYYDPFFEEEDVVLSKPVVKEAKDELLYTDVINEKEVSEEVSKVQDVIKLVDKKEERLDNFADTITNFEMEQEENAIISLDELSKISDRMYEENEPVQYDDADVPITIDEIMSKINDVKEPEVDPVVVTTRDVIKENKLDTFVEEEEEDFLTDLSRAHRRMSRQ